MALRIIYETDFRRGTQREIEDNTVIRLGRHPSNDCVFDTHADLGVSGYHAELRVVDHRPVIRDLDSRNGLFVNGARIKEASLTPSDLVELGPGGPAFRVEYAPKQYGEKTVGLFLTKIGWTETGRLIRSNAD